MRHPRIITAILSAALLATTAAAQFSKPDQDLWTDGHPLPQNTGALGLAQALGELRTTARLMQVTAHPDDEDGGMLTYEARGRGATVLLLTLTRGEGGQNKFGNEFSDQLGVLRTLELLSAGRFYGVEQRFSRAADFGYSKVADETFQKWGGHDPVLADVVRAIRVFRPDVLVPRFSGTPRDGHGHHQASAILAREAFRAAGDPNRFPEQLRQGLQPWQPKRLYMGLVRANEDWNVRIDTGAYSPLLGESYAQFALEGLAHQTSQGVGGLRVPPGHRYSYYKLADAVPGAEATGKQEGDFFDGMDTSLAGIAKSAGSETAKVVGLDQSLRDIDREASEAQAQFSLQDPAKCAPALLRGAATLKTLLAKVEASSLSTGAKSEMLVQLRTKQTQFANAIRLALGAKLEVSVDPPGPPPAPSPFPRMEQSIPAAVPGETFTVTARLYDGSATPITPKAIELEAPAGWQIKTLNADLKPLAKDDVATAHFVVTVPADAALTKPYWHRTDTQAENLSTVDDPAQIQQPFAPPPLRARATIATDAGDSDITSYAQVKWVDSTAGQMQRELTVVPEYSVELQPPLQVLASSNPKSLDVAVVVRANDSNAPSKGGKLRLELPAGWKCEPLQRDIAADGEATQVAHFIVTAGKPPEGRYVIKSIFESGGKQYREGFATVTRPDLGTYYFYRPATQQISVVDVKLPEHLRVGYVPGAGDDIPSVLRTLGIDVQTISASELLSGDLSRYDTIVLGIRAYDVRTDMAAANPRLLDFTRNGGTLMVLYNKSDQIFNSGHFTPYPATLSDQRVSVEETPVEILEPDDRVFHQPNQITERDFTGWVQERGINFWSEWDTHYRPLLAAHDPGEPPLKGGLLVAPYGKGLYIYNGYVFFRELPAGVPGAMRLFVNLLAAGHTK